MTLSQPRLSIIVPIYNVEPYLRKCVDSLLMQDYDDYEIILVDDGSPDGCPQICDEYTSRLSPLASRLRVIHQSNAGISVARNTGIEAAQGEYICFVDSDDYWEPNVLGTLMAQVERDNLDVLRFKYQHVNEQYELFRPYKADPYRDDDYSDSVTDGIRFLNERLGTGCYAVMYILRRDMIYNDQSSNIEHQTSDIEQHTLTSNTLFTPSIYFEDTDWLPRMLIRAKRVASTDRIVYNYLMRSGSITHAINREKQLKVLDDKMSLIGALYTQSLSLREQGQNAEWYYRMVAATVVSIIGILSTDFYEGRYTYIDKLKRMEIFPIYGLSLKVALINISPLLAVKLIHWKNKGRR